MAADETIADSHDLVLAAQRGDTPALDVLLTRHLPALRAFVRLRADVAFRARESCSDLVQTACRQALEHLHEFEWRGEDSFRNWLFALANNKVLNRWQYHRAARRDPVREAARADDSAGLLVAYSAIVTPSEDAIAHEFAERLEAAIDQLPASYREVLLLARVAGLSHPAIAERLGVSEAAARTRLTRARARLATLLDLGG
jgi:RNA polymerase sigma-70 factor (ECF subfamily)